MLIWKSKACFRTYLLYTASFILIIASIFLAGCSHTESVDISWQKYPFTLNCVLKCEGRFNSDSPVNAVITVTAPYEGSITFTSPDSMCGYSVALSDLKATFSYEKITVPCGERTEEDIIYLFSAFALNPEDLNDINVIKQNGSSINKAVFTLYDRSTVMSAETSSSDDDGDDKAVGTLTVYISSDDGIPRRMEAEFASGEELIIDITSYSNEE